MDDLVAEIHPRAHPLPDREQFMARIGHRFNDCELLELALRHRSSRTDTDRRSNERLEFLGDTVLQLVVTDWLYQSHPDEPEGRLSLRRTQVVATGPLAAASRRVGLDAQLQLSSSEDASGGRAKTSILADALEALIGAVYLDAGVDQAAAVVRTVLDHELANAGSDLVTSDPKNELQQRCVSRIHEAPVYTHTTHGPAHDRTFSASVHIAGQLVGTGQGRTRKQAEQAAAAAALTRRPRPRTEPFPVMTVPPPGPMLRRSTRPGPWDVHQPQELQDGPHRLDTA
jgi:ribonuclease-3